MAVSSTTSTTNSTTSIDVASIVSQLMTVENRPLDAVKAKISTQNLMISDLATLKGKVSAFQQALQTFQDPKTFNATTANSTDANVVQVNSDNGAELGTHSIVVSRVATNDQYELTGYASANDAATVDPVAGFSITVNGVEYNTKGTPAGTPAIGANPTVTNLRDWINGLGVNVSASLVSTNVGGTQYSLMVHGTETGGTNSISFSGLTGTTQGNPPPITSIQRSTALDAMFTVDGTPITRASNSVKDVINGVTLNLIKPSPSNTTQVVSISKGTDLSNQAINTMITAYNDMITSYKAMIANPNNSTSTTLGNFANSPTTLAFINEIKSRFAQGITYKIGDQTRTMSLSDMGIDLQTSDGTAKFNAANFATASANGLQGILAQGVTVGGDTNKLDSYLTVQVQTGGALDQISDSERETVTRLTTQQDDLQTRLNAKQAALTNQYSALNTLLFQLSNTSNALTSALTSLTNSQSKN